MKKFIILVLTILALVGVLNVEQTELGNEIKPAVEETKLEFRDKEINFAFTDDNKNEDIIIKSDRKDYAGSDSIYFSVENTGVAQNISISALFSEPLATFEIHELKKDVPREVTKRECQAGTKTETQKDPLSGEDRDVEVCLEPLVDVVETVYEDKFEAKEEVVVQEALKESVRTKEIPKEFTHHELKVCLGETTKEGIEQVCSEPLTDIEIKKEGNEKSTSDFFGAGETKYYVANMHFPISFTGSPQKEFYIEAYGDRGGFGSLDPFYDNSWRYRIALTVDNTKVDADLTDFPVYVNLADLSADFHTNVKSDGGDIRVTTSDGTTEVPTELVFYDSSTDTGELYFKAPSLANSTDTVFYIYYGNSAASAPAENATYGAQNVWKSAYTAVYHLHEAVNNTSNGYKDSTANNRDGTGTSMALTEVSGKLAGKAQDFDGTADYINTEEQLQTLITNSTGTVTAWANTDVTGATIGTAYQGRWVWGDSAGYAGVSIADATDGAFNTGNKFWSYNFDGEVDNVGTTYSTGTWYHIGWRHAGGTLYNYQNGANETTEASGNTSVTNNNIAIGFGYSFSSTPYWNGKIDELRFSNTDLGSAWISTEYNNTNSPSTFYSDGAQQTNPWDLIASHSEGFGANGGTTSSINTTGANLIVVFVTDYVSSPASAFSDSASNTWSTLTTKSDVFTRTRGFYKINPTTSSTHTFTASGTDSFSIVTVQAWSGVAGTPTFDKENGSTNYPVTTVQPGSVTPAANDSLLVTGLGFGAVGTITINNSFTITNTTNYSAGNYFGGSIAYLVQDTLAATNPTWTTTSGTTELATIISVFSPASGAPAAGATGDSGIIFFNED